MKGPSRRRGNGLRLGVAPAHEVASMKGPSRRRGNTTGMAADGVDRLPQ